MTSNNLGDKQRLNAIIIIAMLITLLGCGSSTADNNEVNDPIIDNVTVPDSTPDPFHFTPITNAPLASKNASEVIQISGINTSVDVNVIGGFISINDEHFTQSTQSVSDGDSIAVQLIAANTVDTTLTAQITVGDFTTDFAVTTTPSVMASATKLMFNLDTIHSINNVSQFQREKFITIHASHTENDWYNVGVNESSDLISEFIEGYDVYFGRDTGGMRYQLSLLNESAVQSGYANANTMTDIGGNIRWSYKTALDARAQSQRQHEHRNQNMVIAAQQHPYWPDGKDTGQGWAFSQQATPDEPFGTATGDYMGQYIAKYFNKNDGVDIYGQPKPKYVEVMNEPLFELVDIAEQPSDIAQIFQFHINIAKAIKSIKIDNEQVNSDVLVGGYTVAFPDFDKQDFARWEQRDKAFIDLAGDDMDFISLHLYDFPSFQNREELRSGSNIEATFDMLEHYMYLTLGEVKPFLVSEYGAQVHGLFNQPWLAERDWYHLRAINSQLMSFLERADNIEMAIPFIPVKAEWGRESETVPYYTRLMRQKKEIEGQSGDEYVYTDMVKFYQLWSEVNGTRVDSYSNDSDFQLDAYVDGNNAFLIINSLEKTHKMVDVSVLGIDKDKINKISIKQLTHNNNQTSLNETDLITLDELAEYSIKSESTVIIKLELLDAVELAHQQIETKYYAETYKRSITANKAEIFSINNVVIAETGEALLRLGLGREHGKSLQPTVTVNGNPISVNPDYRGYDQYNQGQGRLQYFGVIEIPIPNTYLDINNDIDVKFEDDGGFITSISMQYFAQSKPLNHFE
ncbi:hypothetical protein [Shewanella sp. ENK2]|uniref:hypothetical protein n=1 Tax=Shewanella sp. ENK2 TaxID=2775245 RepID=UPI00374A108E